MLVWICWNCKVQFCFKQVIIKSIMWGSHCLEPKLLFFFSWHNFTNAYIKTHSLESQRKSKLFIFFSVVIFLVWYCLCPMQYLCSADHCRWVLCCTVLSNKQKLYLNCIKCWKFYRSKPGWFCNNTDFYFPLWCVCAFFRLLLSKPEAARKALSDNSLLKNIEFNEKFLGEENITESILILL